MVFWNKKYDREKMDGVSGEEYFTMMESSWKCVSVC